VDAGLVERVQGAVVAAVRSRRLQPERLAAAGEAVTRLSRSSDPTSNGRPDRTIGAVAARRALLVRGDVAVDGAPLVVELEPEPMVAAGPAMHGLGNAIRDRRPESAVVSVSDAATDAGEVARSAEGRPLVLVLRDAARHSWQQSVASGVIALRPDAVVVETGLPGWIPEHVTASIETHGAGRVSLEAAADLLLRR
jgi:beta-N-acetylhexosaminidase